MNDQSEVGNKGDTAPVDVVTRPVWHQRWVGFAVGGISLLASLGLAAWSGETPNICVGIWTAIASFVFGVEGLVSIYAAIVADV